MWLCTFALAVSIGAVLLLPFSIASHEVVRLYPRSWYFVWLNGSLVRSLWNYVFLTSNLSLFGLLPFAYFFIESQGLPGFRKGLLNRVYESVAVCLLVVLMTGAFAALLAAAFGGAQSWLALWDYQLPFLYSCISASGVALLLTCTPLGISRMFAFVGEFVVRPRRRRQLEEDLERVKWEEMALRRRIKNCDFTGLNGAWREPEESLRTKLVDVERFRAELEKLKRSTLFLHNVKYPVAMLVLLALTATAVLMVMANTLQLTIGYRTLPQFKQELDLGKGSLSLFGVYGSVIEVIVILYLFLASLVGLYSVPLLSRLRPSRGRTSMTSVIGNCAALLVLSSALPVLARALGLTTFDLLGNFGRVDWLRNFRVVCAYNVLFASSTALCLVTQFTATLRAELCKRFNEAGERLRQRHPSSSPGIGKDD